MARRRYQGVKRTGRKKRQHKGFNEKLPVYLENATEFTDDPILNNPDWVVQTLNSLEQAGELLPGLFDDTVFEEEDGRRRMKGSVMKVACGYVASKKVGMEGFWNDYGCNSLWREAGFERDAKRAPGAEYRPSYQTFYRRMTELEADVIIDRFERARDHLVGVARKHIPEIGRDVAVDTTSFLTPSRLYHACKPGKCPREHGEGRKQSDNATPVPGISATEAEDARHEEAAETPAPSLKDEHDERKQRKTWVEKDRHGRPWRYRIIKGCVYKCLDVDAGARSYSGGRAWTGGYDLAAVDMTTGGTLGNVMFSASRREHAGVPALIRKLERTLDGDMPETISADRGFSIDKTYRFLTRRGITMVAPWRKPNGSIDERWKERSVEYDEYGMPRCPGCGGPTTQHGIGLGLVFRRGAPSIAFRCMLGTTDECKREEPFHIRCEKNWRLLIGLSRDSERYFAVRTAHKNIERTFTQRRRRFGVAGKDETGRMKRRGIAVQRLRAAIAGFLEWLYICLRHGWIGNHRYRNAVRLLKRSGRAAWEKMRRKRIAFGLFHPYGPAAFKLGLVADAEVPKPPWVKTGDEPPPGPEPESSDWPDPLPGF